MRILAVGVACSALWLCSCHTQQSLPQPPQGVQVQPVHLSNGDGAESRFSAVVMPNSQVPLAFRVPGYVTALAQLSSGAGPTREIAEGDHVDRGAVLARLRGAEYEDRLHQAGSQAEAVEAVAHKAELEMQRAQRLFDSQSLTKPEYDAARAQYDATQAQVRAARAQKSEANLALHDTSLTAPLSGDIVKKMVEVGSFVGSGTPAFVLANTDTVKLTVGVPDIAVHAIKLGLPATIMTEALPGRTFHARVTRIAAAADPKTRNFEVEVAIPNHDHALRAGMIASLQLPLPTTTTAVSLPLVPISAIAQSPDGRYGVFLLANGAPGQVARFHKVEIGAIHGHEVEIRRGLSSGDSVVTTGATLLKDGQAVEVLK